MEDRLGMKTEVGMETFSIIKHTLLVIVGVLCLAGPRTVRRGPSRRSGRAHSRHGW
ncbi:MAG: hypothetical protein WDO73_27835 [Ignavibacteriota bacterium]